MTYEVRLRLIVWNARAGVMSAGDVMQALALEAPSRAWLYGERLDNRSKRTHKNDGIMYRISRTFNSDPVVEVERLLDHLDAQSEDARSILLENRGEVSLAIRIYHSYDEDEPMVTPPLHLSREQIERLNHYGLDLDVDLYVLEESAKANIGEWKDVR